MPASVPSTWRRVSFSGPLIRLLIPIAILVAIDLCLFVALHFSTEQTYDGLNFWYHFFDVDREINVPSWFNAALWILAALTAGYFAHTATRFRPSWWLFASICVLFSIDETLSLHERLDDIGSELADSLPFDVGFAWVIPGGIIAAIFVLLLLRLVLSLPTGVRNALVVAGIVFVTGSIGVELIEGVLFDESGISSAFISLTVLEETLEMTGVAIGIAALLHLLEYRRTDGGTAYRMAQRERNGQAGQGDAERLPAIDSAS